ncbi:nuclear transport factor 2 family protein [Goodfellowiella coeruleoviolacea]|uniref:Ketosteroid isomerase-related protein n=1 Tax=Goodfellowiella coeruleoviolacea TaxID=334858 RepID=A0AAE3GL05_9PSEU|nr:nuclear transport factor 2 family protein [Goodfellowiella coeruleoviolacea]MCP2170161.1 Ketosteroid isomerase-related protein [Goodfellowiella coeruleoviolacea]
MTATPDVDTFVNRYAAVWNEPDPALRRRIITELWADDGVEYTDTSEYHGHDAVEARVTEAHEQFVATGGFVFVVASDVLRHHDAVTFATHMVPSAGGVPVWSGVVFAVLDRDGRIQRDYQFTGEQASTRAVVADFLGRLSEGHPERIAELFADTVDWRLGWPAEGHPAVPWIRPRSTRADVADHFRALNAFHVPQRPDGVAPRVLVEGPDAVVLGDIRQTVRASGRAYTARCALHLTVEAGVITRYHVYEDSLTVAQALTGDAPTGDALAAG